MSFPPTFVLLQQEAYLAHGSLSIGLTALRNATFPDKATFYSGFFNTSIALERLMKLVVVTDHMLHHAFSVPSKAELKAYGHDLVTLYASCISVATRNGIGGVSAPSVGSIEDKILNFLSEFATHSRYYNLDALRAAPTNYSDPLAGWEVVLNDVLNHDVPKSKVKTEIARAKAMHELMGEYVHAIQHGMDGTLLPLEQVFTLPVKHALATPYVMVRVFRLLTPLLKIVDEVGHKGFYESPREVGPYVPLFGESFVYFGGSDAEIRRKKRWP